jgi:hypothetical protein
VAVGAVQAPCMTMRHGNPRARTRPDHELWDALSASQTHARLIAPHVPLPVPGPVALGDAYGNWGAMDGAQLDTGREREPADDGRPRRVGDPAGFVAARKVDAISES